MTPRQTGSRVDARVDERALRELYLAPFERIVAAGAWAVMAAYNRVNGTTMTENPLQRDVLKREWGFDGVIMSDWYATRSVAAAGEDLLDLAMPGPDESMDRMAARGGPVRPGVRIGRSTGTCCASCGWRPGSARSMGSSRRRHRPAPGAMRS